MNKTHAPVSGRHFALATIIILVLTAMLAWTDDAKIDDVSVKLQKEAEQSACKIIRTDLLKLRKNEIAKAKTLLAPSLKKIEGVLAKFGQRLKQGKNGDYLAYYNIANQALEAILGEMTSTQRCLDRPDCAKQLKQMEAILGPHFDWLQGQSSKITCPKGSATESKKVFDRGFAKCQSKTTGESVFAATTMWLASSREELEPPLVCAQIKLEDDMVDVSGEFYRVCVGFNIENPNDMSAVTYEYVDFEIDETSGMSTPKSVEFDFEDELTHVLRLSRNQNEAQVKTCFAAAVPEVAEDESYIEMNGDE